MRTLCVGFAAIALVASVAVADVIVDQPYDGSSGGYVAQVFPDFTAFSTFQFDDFSTSDAYYVSRLFVPGSESGDTDENEAVIGEIWNGLPDEGGTLIMSGAGSQIGEDLEIDFAGQELAAGNYWITAYVQRQFLGDSDGDGQIGGQWYWNSTQPVNGSQSQFYNPGGGFGVGTDSIDGELLFGVAADMAFTLEGRLVPEPSSIALLATGLLCLVRRRA
jgi:hypothetical protein